jgi:hypothetical protein
MKNFCFALFLLILAGCNGNNVPISDVMHPEVHNNIYLGKLLEDTINSVTQHKEDATKVHLDVHAREEKLLSDAVEGLKKLHREAEENARRRFEDIEAALRAAHKKHFKVGD